LLNKSNDAQRIIGTWVSENGQTTFIFNANGTGTMNGDNISYGISAVGKLFLIAGSGANTIDLYFSPDGRRMIIGINVFIKK
jgi:hypothetical protein